MFLPRIHARALCEHAVIHLMSQHSLEAFVAIIRTSEDSTVKSGAQNAA